MTQTTARRICKCILINSVGERLVFCSLRIIYDNRCFLFTVVRERFKGMITFRSMTLDDLEVVCEIEQRSAEHPWQPTHFRESLTSGYVGLVVESEGQIIGHCMLMLVAGEASILIFTVDQAQQGKGIGRLFLQSLVQFAQQQHCDTLFLEVRKSNHRAFQLYLTEGFCEVGIRKNYYPTAQGREDAIVMVLDLQGVD